LQPYSRDQEALSKQPCGVKSRNEQQGEAIAFGKAASESAMERWKHLQNVLKRMSWRFIDGFLMLFFLNGFIKQVRCDTFGYRAFKILADDNCMALFFA